MKFFIGFLLVTALQAQAGPLYDTAAGACLVMGSPRTEQARFVIYAKAVAATASVPEQNDTCSVACGKVTPINTSTCVGGWWVRHFADGLSTQFSKGNECVANAYAPGSMPGLDGKICCCANAGFFKPIQSGETYPY